MKNLAYIVLFLTQLMAAQSFTKGNELYRKGNYAGAAQEYEGVLKKDKESAELYFNLGNAYYKMNKVAPAIYNYEKALQLDPGNGDIKANLGFAHKMIIDEIKEVPNVCFSKMVDDSTSVYHHNTWPWIAVAFSALFFLLFLGYYLAGTTLLKRVFFVGMFIALLIIVDALFSAVFTKAQEAKERPAIVFSEVVAVKTEPNAHAHDAFILHEGTKVNVLETLDNYKKVELADESIGWIESSAIKEIK